ncbi:hypothetical protein [Streptomyces camelliae]|uniref:Penicillin-binding protein transpeptidase domain-containing protein n=1 Tax=Streptomyces camelliae TaxID=3004093 RepID=A0ABY7P634_9ACTN|nr:hypothetical protein [Streptomyces sp. HUAS 2-6]WBO64984.1 hypothetical protein O1G22_20180 [Streptomyces sp. HUAS 2-6]
MSGTRRRPPQPPLPAAVRRTAVAGAVPVSGSGSSAKAQALGRTAAGKTGTTDDYRSAWFIGYTRQLATSVVLVKEDPAHPQLQSLAGMGGLRKVFGGDIPTEIWTRYMRDALAGLPDLPFPAAPSLGPGTNEPGVPSASPTPVRHVGGKPGKRTTTTATPGPGTPATGPKCHAHKCR